MSDPLVAPPPPWNKFLTEIDDALAGAATLHCIGGFVLVVLYGLPRATDDLDVIAVIPQEAQLAIEEIAGPVSTLAERYRVCIHSTGIVDIPDGYENRLELLRFGYQRLHLAVPDPYDLVLSKLARNSPKDRDDVKFIAGKRNMSFAALMARFDQEMRPWIANVERHLTTLNVVWRPYFR